MSSGQYHLLGVDIREKDKLQAALGQVAFDWTAPTMILSEVVLTYMETQQYELNNVCLCHPVRTCMIICQW